jgi:hypothetical protein
MSGKSVGLLMVLCFSLISRIRVSEAATQFDIIWHAHNHPNSCITPGIPEGEIFFNANSVPIPTYTVAGSLGIGAYGEFRIDYHAPFSGTLFNVGQNDIEFGASVAGQPVCASSDDAVYLTPGNRLLFAL